MRLMLIVRASIRLAMITGLFLATLFSAVQAQAQAQMQPQDNPLPENCFDLWKERNQYYAKAHYCFKTQKAKDEFKEEVKTCTIDEESKIQLTDAQFRRIAKIIQRERAYGCSSN
jgi:hypothetical protein